jgi:nucleoside-diphosphate-sugar epimerase
MSNLCLVTGGGGFLGRYIVEQLLANGRQVRIFSRGAYPQLQAANVDVVQGDLRDPLAVQNACRDVQTVFHTAAVPGVWGSRQLYFGTNLNGTQNVINACLQHGVQRLIYTSSPSVVFDGTDHIDADERLPYPTRWLCHYPHSKALAEQQVLAAAGTQGLRTVSLRPHLIWGPRDNHLIPRLLQAARSGRLRQVGDGTNVVSVAYVENVAAAHLQAERSLQQSTTISGRPYFINEPQAVNLWTWINQLLELAGMPPLQQRLSFRKAALLGGICETLWTLLPLPGEPPMTRFVAAQLAGSHSYSIQAAQRDFGYQPLVSMEQGLQRLQPELPRMLNG